MVRLKQLKESWKFCLEQSNSECLTGTIHKMEDQVILGSKKALVSCIKILVRACTRKGFIQSFEFSQQLSIFQDGFRTLQNFAVHMHMNKNTKVMQKTKQIKCIVFCTIAEAKYKNF